MKKLLLNTFGLFAVFFTLLAFSSTASAVEKSFTITFLENDNKTNNTGTTMSASVKDPIGVSVESGAEYVASMSDFVQAYANCSYGFKIGSAKNAGGARVTFATPVKATKIEVLASVNKNASYQKLEIGYNETTQNPEFSFTDEINDKRKTCTLTFDGTTEISSIYLNKTNSSSTSSQQGFIFIKSITVTYNEEVGNPDYITPELTWSAEEVTAVLGDESFVAPTLTFGPAENAEDVEILTQYRSSDPNVATIDNNGKLTLVGRGTTTITAYVEEGEGYNAQEASYKLTVTYTQASLKWSAESVVVNLGDTFEAPTLTFEPEELAIADNLAYTSSDPTVATIDAKTGAVEIVGAGTTVITASIKGEPGYEDAEASYTLSVVDMAAVPDQYELTFIDKTGESGTTTGYTNKWEKTLNDFTWEIANFNTNSHNNGWTYIKCGSKSAASVATITTASAMAYPVNQIDLTIDAITANSVNSIKLLTSTSATDFSNPVHSIDIEKTATTHAINIPNPQVNLYYRLEFDCKKSSNGVVTVSKVVYNLKKDNKESAELAYATTTVNKATTDQPFINPLTNEHGVEIVYSSDNEAVATVDASTGEVTVVGVGQAVISADFAGNDTYSKQTVSYTLNVALGVNSIEETLALADNTEVLINYPLTVAFCNGNNVFAVDEAGKFIQIYGSNSYAANDIIPAGWTGQYVLYSGATPEIKPVSALPEAVAGGSFVPAVVDPTTVTVDMVNSVVLLKNAVIDAATPTGKDNFDATIAGNTVNLRTNYMSTSASAGVYDITAVVNLYNNAVSLYAAGYKAVPAFRINGELVTETTFDANGLKIKLEAVLPEGHQMWYRFTPVEAASSQAVTDEDGFTKYESAFELEDPGKLEYYSVDPDNNKSEVYELRLDNVTGINDIVVDGDNSEAVYYNLQGVRVDNPNTGIYLVRRAGRVSKVFVK